MTLKLGPSGVVPKADKDDPVRLHIGGRQVKPGWKILDIRPGPHVDFVGRCTDLSRFADGSVASVYSAHVFEHLGFRSELPQALAEVRRVLARGGQFCISVPDLDRLCRLFIRPDLPLDLRIRVVKMIFGQQAHEFDFHKFGFSFETLTFHLAQAGFTKVTQVREFDLFEDSSRLAVEGTPISVNIIAE
ncbi:MAG: methyltransferase domain-containing protein [Dongiaceae bacterium]